ncbi:Uncharacterised protein [Vibrio cholerae]|nr:Uncharacterised protein [Vibrio cholerae]CSE01873.1 Uncharacterised protein [Vibrio cholerae]CSI24826.1 Uncharacterised protein [Vibrio cholerae]
MKNQWLLAQGKSRPSRTVLHRSTKSGYPATAGRSY